MQPLRSSMATEFNGVVDANASPLAIEPPPLGADTELVTLVRVADVSGLEAPQSTVVDEPMAEVLVVAKVEEEEKEDEVVVVAPVGLSVVVAVDWIVLSIDRIAFSPLWLLLLWLIWLLMVASRDFVVFCGEERREEEV